jgi:hypothetical protein
LRGLMSHEAHLTLQAAMKFSHGSESGPSRSINGIRPCKDREADS